MKNMQILSKNIRALRGKQSLTDFSKELGISKSALQAIEKGQSVPRMDTLEIISERMGLTLPALLSEDLMEAGQGEMLLVLRRLTWVYGLPKETQRRLADWLKETAEFLTELSEYREAE